MNKLIINMLSLAIGLFALTACMDEHDNPTLPEAGEPIITSPVSVGDVNATIGEVKDKYCASAEDADFSRNQSNFFTKVKEDLVIDGVIVANDQGGNLYQTLMIRNINDSEDQCIILAVKNTCLYPYFALGQRIKVNLKNLYAGCYSKVPRIGQPYWSSQGNLNLGPVLLEMMATNVELVGKPDRNVPELVPFEPTVDWLRASANKTYRNTPLLATVKEGKIKEVQGDAKDKAETGEITGRTEPLPKILAPEELHDLGYGVDRTIQFEGSTTSVALRTSTQNAVSFLHPDADKHSYTGILSYYDSWQMQLRDVNDIQPAYK